jgi:DNA mismatch repair protein MutL
MPIRRLPPLLVSQIAAGEVIERPASAVKELIENAIDAQATRIAVAIESGGRDLIRVSDDGEGIPFEELVLAVAPHATSKVACAEDLDAIATLGFRGEALASLASVGRLAIVSRPQWAGEAGSIEAQGQQVGEPRPAPGAPGTTVTVRSLFFNTPARRRFLRSDATEAARVARVVEASAMPHPAIAFTLDVDGRRVLALPAAGSWQERVVAVLGPELGRELLEVRGEGGGIAVSGLAGRPGTARSWASHLHVYLNGRPIADRTIAHAIREAYRGLIEPSRHPTIVLFLEMDPGLVDVNVHPAKAEVRFRDQPAVHAIVQRAVAEALRGADLIPSLSVAGVAGRSCGGGSGAVASRASGAGPGTAPRQLLEQLHRLDPREKGFVYRELREAVRSGDARAAGEDGDHAATTEVLPEVRPVTDVLQVHAKYLVVGDEQGILIIDQHALHERVMFEQLLDAVAGGNLEAQRLLVPATVELDAGGLDTLQELQPLLERIGIEAGPIGRSSAAIHAFPTFLFDHNVEPGEFLAELIAKGREGPRGVEAALSETLDMMACKAAVKAGDRLARQEIARLLAERQRVERSGRCPHGRPTTIRLTLSDLDRHFGRR